MSHPSGDALLSLRGVSKRFGAVKALTDVTLELHAGEALALLGDNGAGKSTLIKIVAGEIQSDSGQVFFEDRVASIRSPSDAKALGIETVYQDLSLCPNVDVVANFFMGREEVKRFVPFLDERRMQRETEEALTAIGTEIPSVRTRVDKLSGGQRQAIELCRFVHWGGRLAILDEPFAALSVEQTRRGLELIERVKSQGIGVLVITHNVLHALRVADRAAVLRQGRLVATRRINETDHEELVRLITGEVPLGGSRDENGGRS